MSRNLGELGTAHDPIDVEFVFFGETIRGNPGFGEVDLVDFMEAAEELDENDTMRGLPLVKRLLRAVIHPDDFDRFWATARANRQSMQDLMIVGQTAVGAAAGRPTGPSSDSTAGRSNTEAKSTDDSYSQAMKATEGRPDLQLFVRQAHEARQAG